MEVTSVSLGSPAGVMRPSPGPPDANADVEVDWEQLRTWQVQLAQLVSNFSPGSLNDLPLLPGVDIRGNLGSPVPQVLPLVSGHPKLVGTVRDEDAEAVPAKLSEC